MATYDINSHYDISIMEHEFNYFSSDEWQDYIEFAKLPEQKKSFSFTDVGLLIQASRCAGRGNKLSPKQLMIILSLVERIEELKKDDDRSQVSAELMP